MDLISSSLLRAFCFISINKYLLPPSSAIFGNLLFHLFSFLAGLFRSSFHCEFFCLKGMERAGIRNGQPLFRCFPNALPRCPCRSLRQPAAASSLLPARCSAPLKSQLTRSPGCLSIPDRYTYSASYAAAQAMFEEIQASYNPNNIAAMLQQHPFHVDALLVPAPILDCCVGS